MQVFEHRSASIASGNNGNFSTVPTVGNHLLADIFTYSVVHYGTLRIYLACFEPAMSNLLEVVAAHRCGMVFISEHGLWGHVCTRVLFGIIFSPSRSALHEFVDSQHELLQQALANTDPNLLARWVSVVWLIGR